MKDDYNCKIDDDLNIVTVREIGLKEELTLYYGDKYNRGHYNA